MTFGHEKLDVYRAAIEYVGWAFRLSEREAQESFEQDNVEGDLDIDAETDTDSDSE